MNKFTWTDVWFLASIVLMACIITMRTEMSMMKSNLKYTTEAKEIQTQLATVDVEIAVKYIPLSKRQAYFDEILKKEKEIFDKKK